MRRFIDYRKTSGLEKIGSVCTRRYIEMEIPLDTKLASIVYIMPQNSHSALVATCWGDIFDQPLAYLQEAPYRTANESWPLMAALLANATNKAYTEALLRVNDLDHEHGQFKWFVVSEVEGITCDDMESLVGDRTQQVMEAVLATSMKLLLEVQENAPGTFPPLVGCGQNAVMPWLGNILAICRRA